MGRSVNATEELEGDEEDLTSKIDDLIHRLPPERQLKSVCKIIEGLIKEQTDRSPIGVATHPKELQSRICNSGSPYVKVIVNGISQLEMKVDSGASRTIISERIVRLLHWAIRPLQSGDPTKFLDAGGYRLKVIGKVPVHVALDERNAILDFFIIETREELELKLLGTDLAKKLGLVIDLYTNKVYFHKNINNESPSSAVKNERGSRISLWQPWMKFPKGTERTAPKHTERKKRPPQVGTTEYKRKTERQNRLRSPRITANEPVQRRGISGHVTAQDIFINNALVLFQTERGLRYRPLQYHGLYAMNEATPHPWSKATLLTHMIHIVAIRSNDYIIVNIVTPVNRERSIYTIAYNKKPCKLCPSTNRIVANVLQVDDLEDFWTNIISYEFEVGQDYGTKILESVVSDVEGRAIKFIRGSIRNKWVDAKEWPN